MRFMFYQSLTYLCNLWRNSIAQYFPVEALLGHIDRQATGPLEGISQTFELHIGNCEQSRKLSKSCIGYEIVINKNDFKMRLTVLYQLLSKGLFRPSSMPCLHVAFNYSNLPSFHEKQMSEYLKE